MISKPLPVAIFLALLAGGSAQPSDAAETTPALALRGLKLGRSYDAGAGGRINPSPRVPKPRIITKTEWGGLESSGTMRSHFPERLTLHHVATAKPLTPQDDPTTKLLAIQKWGNREKGWADLPYHFLIDLEGKIYEGRDVMKVGDTSTKYDPAGHFLVSMIGNYELQAPNEKQLAAIADLMAWGSDYFNIDPSTIAGHRDHVAGTQCPGRFVYPYVTSGFLEGEVRRRISTAYAPGDEGEIQTDSALTSPPQER